MEVKSNWDRDVPNQCHVRIRIGLKIDKSKINNSACWGSSSLFYRFALQLHVCSGSPSVLSLESIPRHLSLTGTHLNLIFPTFTDRVRNLSVCQSFRQLQTVHLYLIRNNSHSRDSFFAFLLSETPECLIFSLNHRRGFKLLYLPSLLPSPNNHSPRLISSHLDSYA